MSNYKKGADLERYVVHIYRQLGWFAIRSAGSHSPVDVVAVPHEVSDYYIHFVQCKSDGRIAKQDIETLLDLKEQYDIVPMLAYKGKGKLRGWTICKEIV